MSDLRRAVIILAKSTGWGKGEIQEMDEDDFWADLAAAQQVDLEIAEAMKP
jgi:hypothetical protein